MPMSRNLHTLIATKVTKAIGCPLIMQICSYVFYFRMEDVSSLWAIVGHVLSLYHYVNIYVRVLVTYRMFWTILIENYLFIYKLLVSSIGQVMFDSDDVTVLFS